MSIEELNRLYLQSNRRIDELRAKMFERGRLSRRECDQLRRAVQRVGLIARELWVLCGKPDDPMFENLRHPIPLTPLPASMRSDGWPPDVLHDVSRRNH